MGEWLLSRRDGVIVARHEVPGESVHREDRPVGYAMIRTGVGANSMIGGTRFRIQKPKKVMSSSPMFCAPQGLQEVRSHRKGNTFVSVFG